MITDNVETRVWVDGKELSGELVKEGVQIFALKNLEEGYAKGVDAGWKRGLIVGAVVGSAIAGVYGYKLYTENKMHRENMVKLQALSEKLRVKVENAKDDRKENMAHSRNEKEEVK